MIQLEEINAMTGQHSYGMSSAKGDTTDDLPKNVPQGSSCMDYTTKNMYFFDGESWN